MADEKLVKDPVHGYIAIPGVYCNLFVDTPIFQRLRLIEQTSMRWLFPGARHDRFIHSLGVYHLASRIYEAIQENVRDEEIKGVLDDTSLKQSFLVAALMHDCGHAPFSHTFEKFYNRNADGSFHNATFKKLKSIVPEEDADDFDFTRIGKKTPAHHEAMSAYVLLSQFSASMKKVGVNPGLAARMITGVPYGENAAVVNGDLHIPPTGAGGSRAKKSIVLWYKVANVLISLVNGTALDVDKLDYTIRDTWASGVKNTAIDVDRLIRGATIARIDPHGKDMVVFAFKKSAISVVQSVIDARNYLYDWVYGHHTVLYYSSLLEQAVVKFAMKYAKEHHTTDKSVLKRLFSPEMFSKQVALSKDDGLVSYLLSDADILHFLKRFVSDELDYVAYFSHRPYHIPLWKTAAEYRKSIDQKHQFAFNAKDCIERVRGQFHLSRSECFACDDLTNKVYDLTDEAVQIEMSDGEVVPITSLAHLPQHPHMAARDTPSVFFVYLDVKKTHLKEQIIDYINKLPTRKHAYCRCPYAPQGKRCMARNNHPCFMLKHPS